MSDVTVQNEPVKQAESAANTPAPAAAPPPAPASAKGMPLTGEIVFNENITVYSGNRLPQYDKGPVKAYTARGTDKVSKHLFAMVCEDHLTPRSFKAPNYFAILNPSLVRLVASGVIDWTPAGKEKYCFIFENTLGNSLMKDDTKGGLGMKPDLVLNSVIRPMVNVLMDMRDKDIIHGNIRVSNMFDGGTRALERVVLGECLATPVSYLQPVLYETIDRALGRARSTMTFTRWAYPWPS